MYIRECERTGMQVSMSRKATPTDAAYIERVNKTLKREFNLRQKFNSFEEAQEVIYLAILVYNELRPHWSLGLRTPAEIYAKKTHIKLTPSGLRPTGVSLI
jgi:transposase InsO family protein